MNPQFSLKKIIDDEGNLLDSSYKSEITDQLTKRFIIICIAFDCSIENQ